MAFRNVKKNYSDLWLNSKPLSWRTFSLPHQKLWFLLTEEYMKFEDHQLESRTL